MLENVWGGCVCVWGGGGGRVLHVLITDVLSVETLGGRKRWGVGVKYFPCHSCKSVWERRKRSGEATDSYYFHWCKLLSRHRAWSSKHLLLMCISEGSLGLGLQVLVIHVHQCTGSELRPTSVWDLQVVETSRQLRPPRCWDLQAVEPGGWDRQAVETCRWLRPAGGWDL